MFIVSFDMVGKGGDMGYPERELEKEPAMVDRVDFVFEPVPCRAWLTDEGISLNLDRSDFSPERLKKDPHDSWSE